MTTKLKYPMIPYQQEDRDIYIGLEFDPNEREPLPDAMYQEPTIDEFMYLLRNHLAIIPGRRDVFISSNTFICYDRSNLNVRIGPDCYVSFGVDASAIRNRRLYLPWEAGKMPDFVLEIASESTAENDMGNKREIYQMLGIGEYWRFDPSGSDFYGEQLIGELLVNGRYQRLELSYEADGSIRGYSPALGLYLSWEADLEGRGWLFFYDPATGQRLESYTTVADLRRAAEERAEIAEARAAAAEREARELREQLRRLRGE